MSVLLRLMTFIHRLGRISSQKWVADDRGPKILIKGDAEILKYQRIQKWTDRKISKSNTMNVFCTSSKSDHMRKEIYFRSQIFPVETQI